MGKTTPLAIAGIDQFLKKAVRAEKAQESWKQKEREAKIEVRSIIKRNILSLITDGTLLAFLKMGAANDGWSSETLDLLDMLIREGLGKDRFTKKIKSREISLFISPEDFKKQKFSLNESAITKICERIQSITNNVIKISYGGSSEWSFETMIVLKAQIIML